MRHQRITHPPKEGNKVLVYDLVQGRPLMSRIVSETAFYQVQKKQYYCKKSFLYIKWVEHLPRVWEIIDSNS